MTPAVAKTTMALSQDPEFLKMILSKIPRGRMLELQRSRLDDLLARDGRELLHHRLGVRPLGRPRDLLTPSYG